MIVELGITHVNPNLHLYIFSYLILTSSLHVILFYFVHLQVMMLRMAFIQVKFAMVKTTHCSFCVSQCPKWEINNKKILEKCYEQKVLLEILF